MKQGKVQGINRVPVLMVGSFRHQNAEMNNTSRNPCAAVEQGNIRSAIARIAPGSPVGPENFGRFPDYSEDNLSVRGINTATDLVTGIKSVKNNSPTPILGGDKGLCEWALISHQCTGDLGTIFNL